MAGVGSTERLGLEPAPGGLCLVQDLANTAHFRDFGLPDLLDNRKTARSWLGAALATWAAQTVQTAPRLTLVEPDLAPLQHFRAKLRGWLARPDEDFTVRSRAVKVAIQGGRPAYAPQGDGADGVIALVQAELLLAVHLGTLARLTTDDAGRVRSVADGGSRQVT